MRKQLLSNLEFYNKLRNDFTYHSSAIEGSTLTYADNKVAIESNVDADTSKIKNRYTHDELQENINCGALFDYVITTIDDKLSEHELKIWHNLLKRNTQWANDNRSSYGDYKKIPNAIGAIKTPQPHEVNALMNNFFKDLNKTDKLTINDLAIFHCRFEYIHPFLDGNGRLGRFILLKQCLQNDIDLFVIVNDTRNEYINSLRMYCQTNSHKFLLSYLTSLQKTFKIIYSRFLNRDFNDNESKVIAYISTHGLITRRQVESMLHLSLSGATKILKKLVDKNIIEKHNGSRNIVYRLIFD